MSSDGGGLSLWDSACLGCPACPHAAWSLLHPALLLCTPQWCPPRPSLAGCSSLPCVPTPHLLSCLGFLLLKGRVCADFLLFPNFSCCVTGDPPTSPDQGSWALLSYLTFERCSAVWQPPMNWSLFCELGSRGAAACPHHRHDWPGLASCPPALGSHIHILSTQAQIQILLFSVKIPCPTFT